MDSLAPARSALRAFGYAEFLSPFPKRLKSRNSCQKNFAPLRLGIFELNSTLHPVRNFEQYRNRFGKSAGDSRVQEE
jgi:hypothetical protein